MGDTATTVTENGDGTTTKTIHTELAQEDLVDSLTNMMHIHGDEMPDQLEQALVSAQAHYESEQAGEDGVKVVVE